MKKKVALYMHGGSANHGCEAIVNATCKMLSVKPIVVSANPQEDVKYSLGNLCDIKKERSVTANKLVHTVFFALKKVFKQRDIYVKYMLHAITGKRKCGINMMVGGDNYCYEDMIEDMVSANRILASKGKTVLWGCSIEPELLSRPYIKEDMKKYSLIMARESITYNALLEAGIGQNTHLYPDPAFALEKKEMILPENMQNEDIVGINISPMIVANESEKGIVIENYKKLIEYILSQTSWKVMLIPHVVREGHDDRKVIKELYENFRETGRVGYIDDMGCEELKGYISKCRFFVGARTHSTIAAYSTQVPTLVIGYSVKARGIAQDLFGTWENYVLPVQKINSIDDIVQAFKWLVSEETNIKEQLRKIMPDYISKAKEAGKMIETLINQ